jgi:transcriptional regulator with XRE-family HTH domain
MARNKNFPAKVRWWRKQRGISQLDLAQRAGISQRHLSFLELERSKPSPEMIELIASALNVPMREHNALLVAAGYAPVWREADLGTSELREVRQALDYILTQQEPYPAVVVDRRWNLLMANGGATRLVDFLVGPITPGAKVNLADALIAPDILRPFLLNWKDVAGYFIRSVETDAAADGTDETAALLKGDTSLRLFTTIATLGTPQDITLQELRIESFFPMDNGTDEVLRAWAAGKRASKL